MMCNNIFLKPVAQYNPSTSSQPENAYLAKLPTEMILHILAKTSPNDWKNARGISTAFLNTVDSHFLISEQLREITSCDLKGMSNYLREIKRQFPNDAVIQGYTLATLLQKCTNLKSCSFSGYSGNEQDLKILISALPSSLTQLNLSHCFNLTTVDFSHLPVLTHLNLANCQHLTTANFSKFYALTDLSLYGCTHLKTLHFPKSSALRFLDLTSCVALTAIDFSTLSLLMTLMMVGCIGVGKVDFSSLSALTSLKVNHCNFKILDFSNLSKLKTLNVVGCKKLIAVIFSTHLKLTLLNLSDCPKLATLQHSNLSAVTKLNLNGSAFTHLNLSGLRALSHLSLKECSRLVKLIIAKPLSELKSLNLDHLPQ